MIKNLKRGMAAVLAAALVFAAPVTVANAEEGLTYTAASTGWEDWTTNAPRTELYPSKDGVAEIFIQSTTTNTDIGIEITDGASWITTQTQAQTGDWPASGDGNVWINPASSMNDDFTVTSSQQGIKSSSDIYKVTAKVTKNASDSSKKDVTITLYNVTQQSTQIEVKGKGVTFGDDFNLQLMAIWGGITVYGTTSPTGEKSASDGAAAIDTSNGGTGTTTTNTDTGSSSESGTTTTAKKTMKLSKVKAKKNAKKVTGQVSVKKATVKVAIKKKGKKKFTSFKKATVSGKKFTFKTSKAGIKKLTKGSKVKVKVTKSGYKTLTKTYTVK